jgi:DnaK suppressor protein
MPSKKSSSKKPQAGPARKAIRKDASTKSVKQAVARAPAAAVKSPLDKAELAEFRKMLLAKRQALVGDMNGIQAEALGPDRLAGGGDLSNMPTHPADIGTDNYEQEFTLGLLESERALLGDIDEALARIEAGSYGVCLGTGKPIDKARLRARPWAKYCIEYAKMIEQGLVRPGGEPGESQSEEEQEEPEEDEAGEAREDEEEAPAEEAEPPEVEAEDTEE